MNKTGETFDQLASTYLRDTDQTSYYNALYERPAMLDEIPKDLQDVRVLDAGCAAGWYSEQLTERGASVTGVDVSGKMVQAAEERLKGKAEFLQHDLEEPFPFEDQTFDWIISSLTLHYIKDWSEVFQQFHRLLKPDGILLFSVHHPFMDFTRMNAENYFENKQLTDRWHKPSVTLDVRFYRRSMQDIVNVTTSSFQLDHIMEPRPLSELKDLDKKNYDYLMTHPHFLIVKAVKRS
ncbi:class I SAM-dependent methyltransferase [Halobacillus litoralis]|uniref:class I SAM-dependent methyltransferase n=1 Tax=Halobacillus litoralis TaxID=45668 RepID=UPI001CD26D2A|nr:class I SAM-dependent methyltransferase [Halobacillus litoralis]MCA0969272.1 class I SAM-dependent methyltransferase [Halobacillus litoralis]